MKTAAFFPSRRTAPAVASLARPGKNYAKRQAVAALIKRQILNAGFAQCKLHPGKTRLEVFANVVREFADVLQPWGFTATSEPGPRSRGGVRVFVKPLEG